MQSAQYFSQILMRLELSLHILEKYSNFMKNLPVGAELFHANRWTDRQT